MSAEKLEKLRPDRDLQCYFERPSAIAALSGTGSDRFSITGSWRQQFDWAVLEWNRENVFEHPALRYLPDGDLSGLRLSYEETRSNCIPLDSAWYPTVDWPYLRIWAEQNGVESLYKVPLKSYATALEGGYQSASAQFELQGSAGVGDFVELAWSGEHHTYQFHADDTLGNAAQAIVDSINSFSAVMQAERSGSRIAVTLRTAGVDGNRFGVYANVAGTGTARWEPAWQRLSGGTSPTKWRIDLDFANLRDVNNVVVPTTKVRKMRWTWAADLQSQSFIRGDFQVAVTNWTVTGSRRNYRVPGPGSRRIEDDKTDVQYAGTWTETRGNFSGGSIRYTTSPGATATCKYQVAQAHRLYIGTRRHDSAAVISVRLDQQPARTFDLKLAGEDVLVRLDLGDMAPGAHTVQLVHCGTSGSCFYLDFVELAMPAEDLPDFSQDTQATLATDWDTDHSIALAPERTAWLLRKLGFSGRANHYAGALWFYELCRPGHQYASATVEFSGRVEPSKITELLIGPTSIQHLNLVGDTPLSIARAFELEINAGATGVWAQAQEAVLTIRARAMGQAGNTIGIAAHTNSTELAAQVSGQTLAGGADGDWRTDLNCTPRLNRAARDWTRSYFEALKGYGIQATAALSMELQHGDPSTAAGIAQRYPNGEPAWLNTPALQTNFSPESTAFWRQAFLDLADIMAAVGQQPYLQFGETQWWYFPLNGSGMPFYDAYTTSLFQATYGRPLHVFADGKALPAQYPEECGFLAGLIGAFTNAVIDYVRGRHPSARFEILYAPDVNEAPLNGPVNLPSRDWTPTKIDCFKTENFTYTGDRNLDKARQSVLLPGQLGFSSTNASHLVGIGDHTTPWVNEYVYAKGLGVESVVLFALDQFCLIGYELPLSSGSRRSLFMGA